MTPKLDILYNYDYAKRLYRGDGNFEEVWRALLGSGADFEAVVDECGKRIMDLIPRYTGFSWSEYCDEVIPVYVADCDLSFPQPLTLHVDEDPIVMVRDLIYQLVYRNMSFGFKTEESRQYCLGQVTDRVMRDLQLDAPQQSEWDIKQKTIKEYLKK